MLQKGRHSPSLRMLRQGEGDWPWIRMYEQDPWGSRVESSTASFNHGRRLFIYIFPEAKLRSMVIFTGSQTLAKNIFNKFSTKMDLTYTAWLKPPIHGNPTQSKTLRPRPLAGNTTVSWLQAKLENWWVTIQSGKGPWRGGNSASLWL